MLLRSTNFWIIRCPAGHGGFLQRLRELWGQKFQLPGCLTPRAQSLLGHPEQRLWRLAGKEDGEPLSTGVTSINSPHLCKGRVCKLCRRALDQESGPDTPLQPPAGKSLPCLSPVFSICTVASGHAAPQSHSGAFKTYLPPENLTSGAWTMSGHQHFKGSSVLLNHRVENHRPDELVQLHSETLFYLEK